MKKYTIYQDAGHAWLAVKKKELRELGIADKVSRFSYMKRTLAYLEEDCDLDLFIKAWEKKHGKKWNWLDVKEKFTECSPIRDYCHYYDQRLDIEDCMDGMDLEEQFAFLLNS